MSVWADEDIAEIEETQAKINAWPIPAVLIDTSIVIEHLRKQNRRKSILYRVVGAYDLSVSTIVEFEHVAIPKINGGEPTVRGTRVTVRTILASLDEDRLSDRSFFPSELKGVTW